MLNNSTWIDSTSWRTLARIEPRIKRITGTLDLGRHRSAEPNFLRSVPLTHDEPRISHKLLSQPTRAPEIHIHDFHDRPQLRISHLGDHAVRIQHIRLPTTQAPYAPGHSEIALIAPSQILFAAVSGKTNIHIVRRRLQRGTVKCDKRLLPRRPKPQCPNN